MSMDGKRFAIGLIAGLLVGLAIVTAAGGLGSPLYAPLLPSAYVTNGGEVTVPQTTTTNSVAFTVSSSTSKSNATFGSTVPIQGSLNSSSGSVSSSTTSPDLAALKAMNSAVTPLSSQLASIPQQPPLSNAIILVPVLLAFLLGTVLYRASAHDREETSKE